MLTWNRQQGDESHQWSTDTVWEIINGKAKVGSFWINKIRNASRPGKKWVLWFLPEQEEDSLLLEKFGRREKAMDAAEKYFLEDLSPRAKTI